MQFTGRQLEILTQLVQSKMTQAEALHSKFPAREELAEYREELRMLNTMIVRERRASYPDYRAHGFPIGLHA